MLLGPRQPDGAGGVGVTAIQATKLLPVKEAGYRESDCEKDAGADSGHGHLTQDCTLAVAVTTWRRNGDLWPAGTATTGQLE